MDFTDKRILITGGTGTFGHAIVPKLLDYNIKKIIIFSRDELKQYNMKELFKNHKKSDKLSFFIGDVRDKTRLDFALVNVDLVIHAAALKRVDSIEYNPIEAIKTNIIGTQNIIEVAIKNNIPYFMSISTDKAVSPNNLYGGTKFCLEKLTIAANNFSGGCTKFSVSRYGNVLGSRGSVIQIFKELKSKNEPITITHKDMSRFTMDIEEAIDFVIDNIQNMYGGEIFIPKLLSYNIITLAEYFSKNYIITGLRPGEKIYEEMISVNEAPYTKVVDNKYIIIGENLFNRKMLIEKYGNYESFNKIDYNSKDNLFIEKEILYNKLEKLI